MATSGRLVLERNNLAETRPELAPTDAYLREHLRNRLSLVYRAELAGSAPIAPVNAPSESSRGKV